ncbi:MAG TPA: pilin [Candidatus Paceibacterota bacterium]|nr:pilin [Candidatus Pacearchaeota archaeon]HRZ51037.1 pilin [Candidatus Paceibacterota bacterium]HSA36804.1 pilin [Candidatus Paceibacterota bacterium]
MLKKTILPVLLLVLGLGLGLVPAIGRDGCGASSAVFAATNDEDVSVDVEFVNPITDDTLDKVINNLIDFVFTIALVVCPIVIIIGGFMFVTASGDPKKLETGKKIIFWALIGLAIAIMAKGIVILIRALLGVKKT